jgi:hypothetical protein
MVPSHLSICRRCVSVRPTKHEELDHRRSNIKTADGSKPLFH